VVTKRSALVLATAILLVAAPAASAAKPPSFALWWARFSARVQRDVTHVSAVCQKQYGHDDKRVGRCFVSAERRTLRAEQAAWEKGIARITLHQRKRCKTAIRAYRTATRKAAAANLRYLDSHRRSALTKISRDLNGEPYATLTSVTLKTKSRAVRVCG
jgi:hypothetical protein